jgi:peptide deformylase
LPYPASRPANAPAVSRYRGRTMAAPTARRSAAEGPDPEVAARRAAALAQVRLWGDPVLRTVARPVERIDAEVRAQADRMARLMDDALGAGLAANQVGMLSRLLVYRVDPDAPLRVLVNPEIEWTADDEEPFSEGCLSLPGVWVEVLRPARVRVSAHDEDGRPVLVNAEGREASIVQHEIDHLDGVLFIDRLSPLKRNMLLRKYRKQATP